MQKTDDFPNRPAPADAVVDKTAWLPALEVCMSPCVRLLRPPRFGKSRFLAMMASGCDGAQNTNLDQNVNGASLGESPWRGAHFVLKFDGIGRNAAELQDRVKTTLENFLEAYRIDGRDEFSEASCVSAADRLEMFCQRFRRVLDGRVLLLIDGYDRFTSETLTAEAETLAAVRSFFAVVQKFAGRVFARICLMGEVSVSLDGLVSGFCIATDYSTVPAFAEAFGVTEQELRRRIRETAGVVADEDGLMDRIKSMCGGYRFSRDTDAEVIHPALCQAYLQHLAETGREPVGTEAFADEVADVVGRLRRILSRGEPDFVRSVVDRCLKGEAVACPNLSRSLPLKPEDKLSDIDVLTVLFSLGGLTLAPGTGKTLACPNQVIREQVFGRLAKDFGDWGAAAGKRRTR